MPTAADLVLVYAANRPDDDTSTVGGARDSSARPLDSQFSANSIVAAVSSEADSRNLTVEGVDNGGLITSEVIALNGTTEVTGTKTWAVIGKLTLSSTSGTATVTVRQGSGGTTRHTLNPNEDEGRTVFWESMSSSSAKTYYEKLFWHNTGADALNSATVDETADSAGLYAMGLETSKDDSSTATNRLTAPSNPTFDNGPQNVPTGALSAGEAIGVWFRLSLGSNEPAAAESFDSELAGVDAS